MSAFKLQFSEQLRTFAQTSPAESRVSPNFDQFASSLKPAIQDLMAPLQASLSQEFEVLKETIRQGTGQLRAGQEEMEGRLEQLKRNMREEVERQRVGMEQVRSAVEGDLEDEEMKREIDRLEKTTKMRMDEVKEYEQMIIKPKVDLSGVRYANGQLTFTIRNLKLYPLSNLHLAIYAPSSPAQSLPISSFLSASASLALSLPISLSAENLYFAQVQWQTRPLSTQELVSFSHPL